MLAPPSPLSAATPLQLPHRKPLFSHASAIRKLPTPSLHFFAELPRYGFASRDNLSGFADGRVHFLLPKAVDGGVVSQQS